MKRHYTFTETKQKNYTEQQIKNWQLPLSLSCYPLHWEANLR